MHICSLWFCSLGNGLLYLIVMYFVLCCGLVLCCFRFDLEAVGGCWFMSCWFASGVQLRRLRRV